MFAIIRMCSMKIKPQVLCIKLNPFEHENGRVRYKHTPNHWEKKLAWQHRTKPGSDAQTFLGVSPTKETQAIERLYKDAPPSALMY